MSNNKKQRKSPHRGSSLNELLADDGLLEQFQTTAIKELLAWQISEAMQKAAISKTEMAQRMNTSRAQLDRLLDPDNDSVTLATLQRAACVLGRKIKLELV